MSGYHAKRRLGQNFLKTPSVIARVVRLVDPRPGETVIEIGPGRGALTLPLARFGVEIQAVEFDRDLIGYLTSLLADFKNVHVVNLDFLGYEPDLEPTGRFKLVGNLPYNITSPVIDWCLRHCSQIECAVLMIQKELAARLTASPGSRDWSPLSIFTQILFEVESCFDVSPSHFKPSPRVTSSVVKLSPRPGLCPELNPQFQRVVRSSFSHRRKLLINNLVPELIPDTRQATTILEELSLERKVRAETLTIKQFFRLTERLVTRKLV